MASSTDMKMPMKCIVCPKKPTFSDLSHLLTHMNSKTHLANYNNLKVEAEGDQAAGQKVAEFKAWKQQWNINKLLYIRSAQKNSNQPRSRARATPRAPRIRQSDNPEEVKNETRAMSYAQTTPVDPNLAGFMPSYPNSWQPVAARHINRPFPHSQPHNDMENMVWAGGPAPIAHMTDPQQAGFTYPDPAQHQLGPATPVDTKPRRQAFEAANKRLQLADGDSAMSQASLSEVPEETDTEFESSIHATVERDTEFDSSIRATTEPEVDIYPIQITNDPWPDYPLKGDVLPGMSCFDAAPPERRQQRNQKKSCSTYEALVDNSKVVARLPHETIYDMKEDADWSMVKSRVITGHPTPSSLASETLQEERIAELSTGEEMGVAFNSRKPERRRSAKRPPKQRFADKTATGVSGDQQRELELQRGALRGKAKRLQVFRDSDANEDADLAYHSAANRCNKRQRHLLHSVDMDQENELCAATPILPSKITDDDAGSGPHVPLPSIEHPDGPFGALSAAKHSTTGSRYIAPDLIHNGPMLAPIAYQGPNRINGGELSPSKVETSFDPGFTARLRMDSGGFTLNSVASPPLRNLAHAGDYQIQSFYHSAMKFQRHEESSTPGFFSGYLQHPSVDRGGPSDHYQHLPFPVSSPSRLPQSVHGRNWSIQWNSPVQEQAGFRDQPDSLLNEQISGPTPHAQVNGSQIPATREHYGLYAMQEITSDRWYQNPCASAPTSTSRPLLGAQHGSSRPYGLLQSQMGLIGVPSDGQALATEIAGRLAVSPPQQRAIGRDDKVIAKRGLNANDSAKHSLNVVDETSTSSGPSENAEIIADDGRTITAPGTPENY